MARGPDGLNADIRIRLSAEGAGEADKLTQALAAARANLDRLTQEFATGQVASDLYRAGFGKLNSEIEFLKKRLGELVAPLDALTQDAARQAAAIEAAALREGQAFLRAAADAQAASDKVNAALAAEAAAAQRAADAALQADIRQAQADADLVSRYEADQARREAIAAKAAAKEEAIQAKRNADLLNAVVVADAAEQKAAAAWAAAMAKKEAAREAAAARAAEAIDAEYVREMQALANLTAKVESEEARAAEAKVRARQKAIDAIEREDAAIARSLEKEVADRLAAQTRIDQIVIEGEQKILERQQAIDRVADANRQAAQREGADYAARARAVAGVNKEQDHLNELLWDGLEVETHASAVRNTASQSYRAEAFDIQRAADAQTVYVSMAGASSSARGKQQAATTGLTQAERAYQDSVLGTSRILAGMPATVARTGQAFDQGHGAAERFSYGLLHISHAVQDAQYGFGAVLNNIPLVVQALGGGPGLAGTVMIAGVAIDTLSRHMGSFQAAIGMAVDPTKVFIATAAQAKAKLEALENKVWKVAVDYEDLRNARIEAEKLREAEEAHDAARKTRTQGAVQEEAKKVVELAGGSGRLDQIVAGDFAGRGLSAAAQSDLDWKKELQERFIPAQVAAVQRAGDPVSRAIMEKLLEWRRSQLATVNETIRQAEEDHAKLLTGKFLAGDETAINEVRAIQRRTGALPAPAANLLARMPRNEAEAKKKEVAEEFAAAEEEFDDLKDAHDKKLAAAAEQGAGRVKQEHDANVAKYASNFGQQKGLGGLLEDEARKAVAGGQTQPGAIKAQLMELAVKRLGAGGVPENLRDEVARTLLNTAIDKALAELAGAGPDIVQQAKAAIGADQEKADKPQVNKEAARVGAPVHQALQTLMLRRMEAGQPNQKIGEALHDPVKTIAKGAGVDADIIEAVVEKIINDAMGKLDAEIAARGGDKQAVRGVAAEHARKVRPAARRGWRENLTGQIVQMGGGAVSEEQGQALVGRFEAQVNRGVNPAIAAQNVHTAMQAMVASNMQALQAMNGAMEGMAGVLNQGQQQFNGMAGQIGMLNGRMGQMRAQRPFFPNTIPTF